MLNVTDREALDRKVRGEGAFAKAAKERLRFQAAARPRDRVSALWV